MGVHRLGPSEPSISAMRVHGLYLEQVCVNWNTVAVARLRGSVDKHTDENVWCSCRGSPEEP